MYAVSSDRFAIEDLKALKGVKGKAIVSFRDSQEVQRVLSGWNVRRVKAAWEGGGTGSAHPWELLLCNFKLRRITYSLSKEPLALIGDEEKIVPLSPAKFYSAGGEFAWKDKEGVRAWAEAVWKRGASVFVQPKFDGVRFHVHRDGDAVRVFTESGRDRSDVLAPIAELARSITPWTRFILDVEAVEYEGDRPIPRIDMLWLIHSKEWKPGATVRLFVHDILWKDNDRKAVKPYSDRMGFLLRDEKEGIIERARAQGASFDVAKTWIVDTPEALEAAIREAGDFPGSEGAMLKAGDVAYKIEGANQGVVKVKRLLEVSVEVIGWKKQPAPRPSGERWTRAEALAKHAALIEASRTYILRVALAHKGGLVPIERDATLTPKDISLDWDEERQEWTGSEDPKLWTMLRGFKNREAGDIPYGSTFAIALDEPPREGMVLTVAPAELQAFARSGEPMPKDWTPSNYDPALHAIAWTFPKITAVTPELEAVEAVRALEAAGDRLVVRLEDESLSRHVLPGGFSSPHDVDPTLVARLDATTLVALHGALHKAFDEYKARGVESEDVVNAHSFVASELARRGMEHRPEGTLDEVSKRFEVRSALGHIELADVLPYFKACALHKPYVSLVGGCAVSGHGEDIDILISANGPDPVTEFRIREMLPPPLRSRIQFLYDPMGPFTNYIPLFSQELVAIEPRVLIALQRVKEEPPTPEDAATEIGRWRGLSREELASIDPVNLPEGFFAIQWHFRGKSVHADLRIKRDGFLEGYTLDTQIAGAIKEDVSTVAQARALDSSYDDPLMWKFRPSMDPSKKVLIQPKARQPLVWLTMVEKAVPPGTVGATREEEGVFWGVDWGLSWLGVDKPFFREVWLKGRRFDARLVLRLLKRKPLGKRESGEGKEVFFWEGWLAKPDSPPTIFTANQRKKRDWVPVAGTSGLPPWWEAVIPSHLRWWPQKLDRRSVLTQMDGAFAHLKKQGILLAHDESEELAPLELARRLNSRMHAALAANDFVLTRHYWRGPTVVRGMPVETFFLRLDRGGDSLDTFVLDDNPLLRTPVVASRESEKRPPPGRSSLRDWLRFEDNIPPGAPGNPNKELPVHVEILDRGKFAPLETRDDFVSFEARGSKLAGVWVLVRESPTSDLWVLSPAKTPGIAR